ncbi:MAG: signal recognition particle protein, partial [Acutalibacteraceae bacterium]|nr:signal recognition particle protein [Acutalibacteraceae bacterium]
LGDLEEFHPDRMASRILGMGDVMSLIEKAEQALDDKKAAELEQKLKRNKFDLNDLLGQFQQIKKMGPLKQVLGMIPGLGKQLENADVDDKQLVRVESIIYSMTEKERTKPEIINASRKKRIAAGCGMKVEDVNRLLRQYEQMKKMFKQMNGGKGKNRRLLKGLGGNKLGFDPNTFDPSQLNQKF